MTQVNVEGGVVDRLVTSLVRVLRGVVDTPRLIAVLEAVLAIVVILIGAALAIRLATSLIRRTLAPRGERFLDETRVRTLQPLVESLVRYVVYFIALVMVLRQTGVDATAILASAGVVGLAVGFGAQHLIRDVISGFFLLAEGLIMVGDEIAFGEHSGLVERISIRTTQLRKFSGELVTIPNGQLQIFGNLNRDFMRAIVEVAVAYEGNVQRAMTVMQQAGEQWAAEHREIVLSPPEVQGILRFGESGVTVRLVTTVKPQQQWAAERALGMHIKAAFDREGIEIAFPRRVTYLRSVREESAQTPPTESSR